MIGSAQAPRFEPAEIQIASGDTVEFVLVSAAPHNVAFDSTALSPAATDRLRKIVHDPMLPLAGPMLLKEGERYTLVFADVPAGRYAYFCMPHMSMQMRGTVVVR